MENQFDKHIKKIYDDTLQGKIDLSKIKKDHLQIILDATYNPVYVATIWKLYKCIYEKNKLSGKLFWISCGNTAGYFKYHGHIPWDDDIDIGFEIDNVIDDYVDFLVECIKGGFNVNLQMKKENNDKLNWYENKKVVNLILDQKNTPAWNHIKVTDFKKLISDDYTQLHFANVTLREGSWIKIAKKFNVENLCKWNNKFLITPWIDVVPHFKKNDHYSCNVVSLNTIIPDLSTSFDYHSFLTIPGKFPKNILDVLLHQYNGGRSFANFLHWDTIYSHAKNIKTVLHYNDEPELLKFIRIFISNYNCYLLEIMEQISFDDLVNLNAI